jgi:hypothetical protein
MGRTAPLARAVTSWLARLGSPIAFADSSGPEELDENEKSGMLERIFPHRADVENIDVSQKQLLHLVGSFQPNGACAPKNSPQLDNFRLTSKRRVPRKP